VNGSDIHIVAATIVFGTIPTILSVSNSGFCKRGLCSRYVPLWETLIAANMSSLACFATEAGLSMALAGRATTGTGHIV
jgi:hypothetical protein